MGRLARGCTRGNRILAADLHADALHHHLVHAASLARTGWYSDDVGGAGGSDQRAAAGG